MIFESKVNALILLGLIYPSAQAQLCDSYLAQTTPASLHKGDCDNVLLAWNAVNTAANRKTTCRDVPGVCYFYNGRVANLVWSQRGLAGALPTQIGQLTALRKLAIGNNLLTGSVPASYANLVNLVTIDLNYLRYPVSSQSYNTLTGSLSFMNGMTKMMSISVFNNVFSGPLPNIPAMTSLTYANFRQNNLNGTLPDVAGLTKLQTFFVHSNKLSGSVPVSYASVAKTSFINNPNLKPLAIILARSFDGSQKSALILKRSIEKRGALNMYGSAVDNWCTLNQVIAGSKYSDIITGCEVAMKQFCGTSPAKCRDLIKDVFTTSLYGGLENCTRFFDKSQCGSSLQNVHATIDKVDSDQETRELRKNFANYLANTYCPGL